jgi:hypothetical protein
VGAGIVVDADAKGFFRHDLSPYGSVIGAAGLPTGWRQWFGNGIAGRAAGLQAGGVVLKDFVRQSGAAIDSSRSGDFLANGWATKGLHDSPFRTLCGFFLLLAKQCGDQSRRNTTGVFWSASRY